MREREGKRRIDYREDENREATSRSQRPSLAGLF